jgi:hypothetical protein
MGTEIFRWLICGISSGSKKLIKKDVDPSYNADRYVETRAMLRLEMASTRPVLTIILGSSEFFKEKPSPFFSIILIFG